MQLDSQVPMVHVRDEQYGGAVSTPRPVDAGYDYKVVLVLRILRWRTQIKVVVPFKP